MVDLIVLDEKRILAASREYLYQVQFYVDNKHRVNIYVSSLPNTSNDIRYSVKLVFSRDDKTGARSCKCFKINELDGQETLLWKEDLDTSMSLVQFGQQRFQQVLQTWHFWNKLSSRDVPVNFAGSEGQYLREIQNETITIATKDFLEKYVVQRNVIVMCPNGEERLPEKWEQIQSFWYSPFVGLTYRKFKKVSAARLVLHIGELSPQNIVDFILAWKSGRLRDNFEWLVLNITNSKFNVKLLWRMLNSGSNTSEVISIEHYTNEHKRGRLYFIKNEIRFLIDDLSKDPAESSWSSFFNSNFRRLLNWWRSTNESESSNEPLC